MKIEIDDQDWQVIREIEEIPLPVETFYVEAAVKFLKYRKMKVSRRDIVWVLQSYAWNGLHQFIEHLEKIEREAI